MAMNHGECVEMVDAFRTAQRPLWVAYYRRALPRFLKVRELLRANAIGTLTSVHVKVTDAGHRQRCEGVEVQHGDAGAGLFSILPRSTSTSSTLWRADHACHWISPEHGRCLCAEDVTAAASNRRQGRRDRRVEFQCGVIGRLDRVYRFPGEIPSALRANQDVIVTRGGQPTSMAFAIRRTCTSR